MPGSAAPLSSFFSPASVAVIGASNEVARIGGRPLYGMQLAKYAGRIYPVNPRHREVMGLRCHAGLESIDEEVELALIALPAAQVPQALQQCVAKRVQAVSIFSSGFAEVGAAGAAAQAALLKTARDAGIRLLGPNCMGSLNTANGFVGTFTSTLSEAPLAGPISVVSQSGAFAAHCYTLLRERGVGIDLWAATGNEADVAVADCIAQMALSPRTRAIIACIEGVGNGRALIDALALAQAANKPVIAIKLGRSAVGAVAVASHTAALAGSDRVFESVLDDHGACRAHSVDEAIDMAYALAAGRSARSRRLGLASISGGFGIMMADAAELAGLELPALDEVAQRAIRASVPFAGTRNPVDLTAQIINEPQLLEPMMETLLQGERYGSVVLFLGASGQIPAIFDRLAPTLALLGRRYAQTPLAMCAITEPGTRARLESWGYLVFEDPVRTIRALAALARFGSPQPRVRIAPSTIPSDRPLVLPASLNEAQAKAMLREAGIPAVAGRLSTTLDDALAAADGIGFPVVMKVLSPDIPHKTDAGCVALDLRDAAAAGAAYERLLCNAGRVAGARIDGVLVEAMAGVGGEPGTEMILGIQTDPVFGPVVMVGLGGIFVEVLTDIALRVAPVTVADAHGMLRELKGYAILAGARGRKLDIDGLAETIARLSRFAVANAGQIASLDINPYLVTASGGLALDAVIVPARPQARAMDAVHP